VEPVTHFLTGACLGRTGFNRKTAYATLAMTLAAEAPDIDMLSRLRGPVAELQHHRGITHTFLGAPFVALAVVGLVWLIHRWRKKPPVIAPRWGLLWLFSFIAVLSHLLLDYTTSYGVRPFFPFNPHWYAWSIVFIFDPVIFLALLTSFFMPWIFGLADREIGARRTRFRGRGWSIAALILIALWWSLRNAEHAHAIQLVRNGDYITQPITRINAEPSMADPFSWRVVAETQNAYHILQVHTLHDDVASDTAQTIYKPQVTPAVMAAKKSYLGRVYLDWSMFPLVTDLGASSEEGIAASAVGSRPAGGSCEAPMPGHLILFQDLRFYDPASGRDALHAWACIGPGNQVEAMFMGGSEQQ
jgi:inner membrane protein